MKRAFINLGLVLVAFAIGVSINNACSKSIEDMSDSDLRSLVIELQRQVNELKGKVAILEEKVVKLEAGTGEGGSGEGLGGFNGGFYVGKVPFFPSGIPVLQYAIDETTTEVISYNKLTGKNDYHYITKSQAQKDSQGRFLTSTTSCEVLENNVDYEFVNTTGSEYSYTNNTCVVKNEQENSNIKLTVIYTYHF